MGENADGNEALENEFIRGFIFGGQLANYISLGFSHNFEGQRPLELQALEEISRGNLTLTPTATDCQELIAERGLGEIPADAMDGLAKMFREQREAESKVADLILRKLYSNERTDKGDI